MIPNGPGCYGPHRRVPLPGGLPARAVDVSNVADALERSLARTRDGKPSQ
jgi:hypothetical protein